MPYWGLGRIAVTLLCVAALTGYVSTTSSTNSNSAAPSTTSGVDASLLAASVSTAYSNNAVQAANSSNVPGLDQAYQVQQAVCRPYQGHWLCLLRIGNPNPWTEKYEVFARADGCYTANDVQTSGPNGQGWQTPQAPVDLTGCLSH